MQIEKPKIDADEFMRRVAGELPRRKTDIHDASSTTSALPPVPADPPKPVTERQTVVKKDTVKAIGNKTEEQYKTKYLLPIEDGAALQRYSVKLPHELHMTLKRLCNLVFDGKVSMAAFVTNVLNDHIEKHRGLYDTLYQPKSWNE